MVDEYQDTNGVQETIINLISRVDNRFYVGDVKQAIYSFRMADSSLFMEKYNTYGDTDAVERRIDLAKEFPISRKYFSRYELLVLSNHDGRGGGAQLY